MRPLVLVLLAVTGCTAANRTAIVASTAALVCDWGQTRRMEADGWRPSSMAPGRYEENPIMGQRPNATTINVYFAAVVVANAVLYAALPRRWRAVPSAVVMLAQQDAIRGNMRIGVSLCGL